MVNRSHEIPKWKRGIAAAMAVGAAGMTLSACAPEKPGNIVTLSPSPDAPSPTPSSESPAPTETESPQSSPYEISSNLEGEELATRLLEVLTNVDNAGTTPEFLQEVSRKESSGAIMDYCYGLAVQNIEEVSSELFTEEALENDRVVSFLNSMIEVNSTTLYYFFLTAKDANPYHREFILTDFKDTTEEGSDETRLSIAYNDYDNAGEDNRLVDLGAEPKRATGSFDATLRVVDGRMKIHDLDY